MLVSPDSHEHLRSQGGIPGVYVDGVRSRDAIMYLPGKHDTSLRIFDLPSCCMNLIRPRHPEGNGSKASGMGAAPVRRMP